MNTCCTHCGQALPDPVAQAQADLSPLMRKIIDVVRRRPGKSAAELADAVYASAPNGGPEWARDVVVVTICRSRKTLARHGLRLTARAPGQPGYRLIQINAAASLAAC